MHPISSYVGPIFGFEGQRAVVGGTAVFIAPGIAITAAHVIDEILGQFGYTQKSKNISLDIYVNQLQTGACWFVSQTSTWVGTDITVLGISPRNDPAKSVPIVRVPMTVDPPPQKGLVTALGFPRSELAIPQNDPEALKLSFSLTPTVSEGEVMEVHSSYRDSAYLRFPCFAVNAEFAAGMSGGAVFNEKRELCGLVCSGGEGALKDLAYATSLWPAAIIPITLPPTVQAHPKVTAGKPYKFVELAESGYLDLRGHDRIEFFKHENGSSGIRRHRSENCYALTMRLSRRQLRGKA